MNSSADRIADEGSGGAGVSAPRGARTLLVVALLGAIYLGYTPALDGEMQFDDLHSILDNAAVKDLGRYSGVNAGALLGGSGRALTDLSFALNYRASGLAVRPYHLVNLALHLATVLAVLALGMEALRRARWPAPFATAWLAAALFGLHPLQTQAVAYLCQRAEVLASLLYVLALLLALKGEGQKRPLLAYAAAFFFVLLGWGAKPTLATFPAALLLFGAAFPRGVTSLKTLAIASLPFWAVTCVFSARLLAGVSGTGHAGFDIPAMSAGRYFLTQSRVLLTYLRLLAWPAGQNLDWTILPSASALEPRTLVSLATIAAVLLAAVRLWAWSLREDRDREIRVLARLSSFGLLWFFLLLAPTSSIVPVADLIEEHRVYLASWGLFLPVAAAAVLAQRRLLPGRRGTIALASASLIICAVLATALHRRAEVWATSVALWSDVVSKSPDKPRGHMNLGYALTPTDPERALAEYRRALQLADGTIPRGELLQDLAGALLKLKRYDEAIAVLRELIATAPASPALSTNLAIAYLESGQLPEADSAASAVATRWPGYAPAQHTLGQLASLRGDFRAAQRHFEKALELDPDSTTSLTSLAVTQERLGDRAGACGSWSRYARSGAPHAEEDALARLTALGCESR